MLRTSLGDAAAVVDQVIDDWQRNDKVWRLWDADKSLWADADEDRWMGWLEMPARDAALDGSLIARLNEHRNSESLRDIAVLGMGGSSLCPDVLSQTFGAETSERGFPKLHVFDSTVPAQVRAGLSRLDLQRTLFVVASKSGSTIEPNMLFAYLWDEVEKKLGGDRAGSRFVAITDPGSSLERLARNKDFAGIAYGIPEIGGRFSALSPFGMLPAALMGIDTNDFIRRAFAMASACGQDVPARDNPGVHLGLVLGTLAKAGHDKLTCVISPAIETLGVWLEQLICESTGKHGLGVVAVGDEPLAAPDRYGRDRLFAYVRLASAPDPAQDDAVDALEAAGHHVIRMELDDPHDLGAEFFRWEIATAVAGSVLRINPFDQPDVESAKIAARALMEAYESEGALPAREPILEEDGIQVFADASLRESLGERPSLRDAFRAHLARLETNDYFSINAYLESSNENEADLRAIRLAVRDRYRVATMRGYGPRFLHSTGQLHKGGPASGVFLQITSEDREALPIPDQRYSFGVLAEAQAQGDFEVLVQRERRAFWAHLTDPRAGLARLREETLQK